jgi:DNA polymerase III subunit delta'
MIEHGFMILSERLCPWLREPLQTLESAFSGARLGHAWLIAGPPGVGKLNLALVLADRLLRATTASPLPPPLAPADAILAMGTRHLPSDHHPDLHWLYPDEDKKSISIDQIRELIGSLILKGYKGGAKVVVLEPAEAMTGAAANALLKCLEEASAETYLLLISHQPGRLPSTIRSRCQTLAVRGPAAGTGSGADGPVALSRTERAPLLAAQRDGHSYSIFINELEDTLKQIVENRRDPQAVADDWRKGDLPAILDWLIGRIHRAIRAGILAGSNPVTEAPPRLLHNISSVLTVNALFEQLDSAERLRDQLGRGVNTELALSALLLGFRPERGRT